MGQDQLDPGITRETASTPPEWQANAVGIFPLSFMQESLWFIDQVAPGISAYNLAEARRLRGRLDIPALQKSLDLLVRRHESLRTVFRQDQAGPVQVVLSPSSFPLPIKDLSLQHLNSSELQGLLKAEAARPFELKRRPLARGLLLRLGPEDHVLLINLHHIICDQHSLNLFFAELAEHYNAVRLNTPLRSSELRLQYADFAVWQRKTLSGRGFQDQIDYWQKKLGGLSQGLGLITDHFRPPFPSYRGETLFFALPADLTADLKQLARVQGATLFMTLLAGFKLFLHRYCRQSDILVGSPISSRDSEAMQRVIGFFVNTHALRTELGGDPTFIELLARVRETVLGAEAHQAVSVDQVVRALPLNRDMGLRSLFEVICSLQPAATAEVAWEGLAAERLEVDNGGAKFDWSLLFSETNHGLQVRCEYSTDLFEAATVSRRIQHFETILKGIVSQPNRALSQFPLLTEAERLRLVGQPQYTAQAETARCLHERFVEQVARKPDAIALTFGQESLSYAELNIRANQLACYLRRHNVRSETPVALYLKRSMEQVIAIMAVLKAGGAYVPIEPGYPTERLRFILEDTRATVVLTQASLSRELPDSQAKVICLDSECPRIKEESAENPPSSTAPENTAYIIYTSGSTGKPKGVLVTHQNVDRLFTETEPWFGFNSQDVWCLFHSYTFDFSVWELWGSLLYGGKLVLVPFLVSRSPNEFLQLLAAQRVTVLNQTPSAFRQLMWAEMQSSSVPALNLRYIIFGGEALELQGLRPWFERHGEQYPRLINMYGITETTVHVTYRVIRLADLNCGCGSPIGVPIPDLKLYLLDESLEPVPFGVPGEICVGGAGVARGYLNRPDLTNKRFVSDPFAKHRGAKLYRSGDLARYTNQGELEYLGRLDDQVKIRGFRIELGDIESTLNQHPAVRQSVVVVRRGSNGDQQLVAYVVPATSSISVPGLRQHLFQMLPDYMLPSAFVSLAELPLTINGKVDRGALPAPGLNESSKEDSIPPRSATEKLIAETWSELLGCGSIGINDNFFHLGGHSLLATQVIARLSGALGRDLSVRTLFEAPTVAGMAEAIEHLPQEASVSSYGIPRRIRKGEARQLLAQLDQLSSAQIDVLLSEAERQPFSA